MAGLHDLWAVEIDIMEEFRRICSKYNLKWFAFGGTLIGAIRHKGFIPWDDDMDVAMYADDFRKFLKVCPSELPSYELQYFSLGNHLLP